VIYLATLPSAVLVLHAFQKKTPEPRHNGLSI
jgi:phage-related protein